MGVTILSDPFRRPVDTGVIVLGPPSSDADSVYSDDWFDTDVLDDINHEIAVAFADARLLGTSFAAWRRFVSVFAQALGGRLRYLLSQLFPDWVAETRDV